jgi:hypothetical protein
MEEGEGGYCAGENQMRERDQGEGGASMGRTGGARGTQAGPDRAGLGRAGPPRGSKPTTRTTTKWNPIMNRNPKRDETNTRLTTTSDKEICFGMMQHPCQLRFCLSTTWTPVTIQL